MKDEKKAFTELWDSRPWWPDKTSDKEMALHYFNAGIAFVKSALQQDVESDFDRDPTLTAV